MPKNIDPHAIRRLGAQLRGLNVTNERAAQLALEMARVNEAARAEGAKNDFNDQPTSFAVILAELGKR